MALAQEPHPPSILSIQVIPWGTTLRAQELEAAAGGLDADGRDAGAGAEDVEPSPTEVDAGGGITLVGTVLNSPARDLRGFVVVIKDQDGSLVGEAEIAEFDGEINTTSELEVKAPLRVGAHSWLAVLASKEEGIDVEEASTTFSFTVRAHATSILVWDVPTAIVEGQVFLFKVGIKCSSGCRLAGCTFQVNNEHGDRTATGALGGEPWAGTTALYYAEIEAQAPAVAGLHEWTVKAPGANLDVPHEQRAVRFGVRTVVEPDCVITVEAVDGASQLPIRGARVVVHPYRVFTDVRGRAEVRVPRGAYRIFISGAPYVPYRADSEIVADTSIRAELVVDRALSDADLWS